MRSLFLSFVLAPVVSFGQAITGVANGASFADEIVAGSWTTVFGSDLSSSTRIWRSDEIVDGRLPTVLDGVSVRINGKSAAVFFISPGQLNVQAPDDDALGPVLVELLHDDVVVATAVTNLVDTSPAFFQFDPHGRKYPSAVHLDGTFVGPTDLFGGAVGARPVEADETILLFGTGFGDTNPPAPSGMVLDGASPLASPVTVFVDGRQASVSFAGLSGAGLYQFNVRIPDGISGGDVAIRAEIAGKRTQDNLVLAANPDNPPPPPPPTPSTPGDIVISQFYGGGSNQGGVLSNDFVELFNRGGSPVDVRDWTVQYTSAKGSSWKETVLSGVIPAGRYFLVQQGKGRTPNGNLLPQPDIVDEISMSHESGKIALVSNETRLSGNNPAGPAVVDFLGYGLADHSEGGAASRLTNASAAIRKAGGCVDSDRNNEDFEVGPPQPRNSSSPGRTCP